MKITKSADRVNELENNKSIGNIGCKLCPTCGENKSNLHYICMGNPKKGIVNGFCKTYAKGFFHMKSYKIDCYVCNTCGTHWESEPYEYN